MNLEQLRRTVGRKTGMDYTSDGEDRNLIDSWCSEGVREVLLRTHCYVAAADVQTTADEWQYDLSTNIMQIKNLWRDGETDPMIRVSPEEILELRRRNGDGLSTSSMRWAIAGSNMLLLWPTPTEEFDLDFLYVPLPTELSFESHDPSDPTYGGIPIEFHKAIELWALNNASDHEHEQGTQRGVNYLAQFDEYIKRSVRPAMNRKGGALSRARVGRGRQDSFDNGRYP